jgi:hypothetical protein
MVITTYPQIYTLYVIAKTARKLLQRLGRERNARRSRTHTGSAQIKSGFDGYKRLFFSTRLWTTRNACYRDQSWSVSDLALSHTAACEFIFQIGTRWHACRERTKESELMLRREEKDRIIMKWRRGKPVFDGVHRVKFPTLSSSTCSASLSFSRVSSLSRLPVSAACLFTAAARSCIDVPLCVIDHKNQNRVVILVKW